MYILKKHSENTSPKNSNKHTSFNNLNQQKNIQNSARKDPNNELDIK